MPLHRSKFASFRRLFVLIGAFWAATPLAWSTVTMHLFFGPLTRPSGTPVENGKLWILVYDENDDGQFPGGLGTDGSLTDPAAAYSAFAGKTISVDTIVDGDRIFAVGEIKTSADYPGVTQNSILGLDVAGMNLESGRKWAFYWFPDIAPNDPRVPEQPFEIGGINEITHYPSVNSWPMTIPNDGALVSVTIYADSLPGGTLPTSRFQAVAAEPANDFSSWISGFFPGEPDPAVVGFDADPDADGLVNGVESILGTAPDAPSRGLGAPVLAASGSLIFHTTLAKTAPSDVERAWEWSPDLAHWFPDGAGDGSIVVDFTETIVSESNPVRNHVKITATPSPPSSTLLFIRLAAIRKEH